MPLLACCGPWKLAGATQGPMGLGCVLKLQPGWHLVPLDSYQNVLGGVSMKQGQDGTVPNILFPRSPVCGGVCPGNGQLPLPGVQRTRLALVVFSQGVWEPSCHSALKGNAPRVEGNHTPTWGFTGMGGRQRGCSQSAPSVIVTADTRALGHPSCGSLKRCRKSTGHGLSWSARVPNLR